MFVLAEFELFEDEGVILALPFDLDGGTQGADYQDAAAMSADWLKGMAEHWLMAGEEPPTVTLGHEPSHGGRVLLVGVEVTLGAIDTVTASEAASVLGVSRSRVSQMLKSGQLTGYKKGHAIFVTTSSVQARLAESPKAGRPRKSPVSVSS